MLFSSLQYRFCIFQLQFLWSHQQSSFRGWKNATWSNPRMTTIQIRHPRTLQAAAPPKNCCWPVNKFWNLCGRRVVGTRFTTGSLNSAVTTLWIPNEVFYPPVVTHKRMTCWRPAVVMGRCVRKRSCCFSDCIKCKELVFLIILTEKLKVYYFRTHRHIVYKFTNSLLSYFSRLTQEIIILSKNGKISSI